MSLNNPLNPPSTPADKCNPNLIDKDLTSIHLNRHPSINYLPNDSTPVPSFPKVMTIQQLRSAQKQSDQYFINNLTNSPQPQPPPSSSTPLPPITPSHSSNLIRLVNQSDLHHTRQSSTVLELPYPNPDLSIIQAPRDHQILEDLKAIQEPVTAHRTPTSENIIFTDQDEELPLSEPPGIGSSPDLAGQVVSLTHHSDGLEQTDRPPPNRSPEQLNQPQPVQNHSTPAVAIKSILLTSNLEKGIAEGEEEEEEEEEEDRFKEQILAELQSRTSKAPGVGRKLFGDEENVGDGSSKAAPGKDLSNDRFSSTHGKQFAKYDSITNHYAAKRKIDQKQTIESNSKRIRVEDVPKGQAQQQVSRKVQDGGAKDDDPSTRREAVRRQLEMARNRRKTNQDQRKSGRHQPSGFSTFGTRLLRSAVKTVKGAFMSSTTSSSAKSQTSASIKASTTNTKGINANGASESSTANVGFGVPAGLGVGPAKVLDDRKSGIPRKIVPVRTKTVDNLNRLPPAGPVRNFDHQRRTVSVHDRNVRQPIRSLRPRSTLTTNTINSKIHPTKSTWLPKTLPPSKDKINAVKRNEKLIGKQQIDNNVNTNKRLSEMKVNSIGIVPQTINCSNVIRTSCRVSRTASTLNASSPLRSSNQLRSMNESTSTDNHKDNKQDEEKENEKEGDEEDGVRIDREKVEEELKKRDQEVRLRKRIEAPIKLTKPIPFKSHFSQNLTNRKLNNNSSSINSNISKSDRKVRSRISQGLVGKAGLVGRNDKASKKKRRSSGLNVGNRLNSHRVLSEQRVVLAKNAGAIGGAEKRKSVVRWR